MECLIVGYTKGKGDRQDSFGALHLAQSTPGALKYLGKVGSGFDDKSIRTVFVQLKDIITSVRPIKEKPIDNARSVWVEPRLVCEVEFASTTPNGMLREPVFIRMRPDLTLMIDS